MLSLWAPDFLYIMNKTLGWYHSHSPKGKGDMAGLPPALPDHYQTLRPGACLLVTDFQRPHPGRLLYPGTGLTIHLPHPCPGKGVNPVTVDISTSLWRTSNSDLERMRWLCPTHIPSFVPARTFHGMV